MTRFLSPFGLQWIRGCEAVDTIAGFTSYKLFELVREGLTPHSESLQPLLPTWVMLMYVERGMWEAWLEAEADYHRSTLLTRRPYLFYQVEHLAKGCDYKLSDDCPPIPVPRHSFRIPGIPGQPIKEKTREEYRNDATKNIASLNEQIAVYGPNPWATIVFDLNDEEVESLALLGAYYKHGDLMARLSATEPVAGTKLSPTMAGSLFASTTPEPMTEAQGQKLLTDKQKVRNYAKGVIDSGTYITRAGLAEKIKHAFPSMEYQLRTFITWTQDLFPDYTPLRPGAKKKNK